MPVIPPTLSVTEVAGRLQVTTRTITRWILEGRFPSAHKRGAGVTSPYCIAEDDVENFRRSLLVGERE